MAEVTEVTASYLKKVTTFKPEEAEIWNSAKAAGSSAPASGIYRCTGCGHEITSNEGSKLPSLNCHRQSDSATAVSWQLVVKANKSE